MARVAPWAQQWADRWSQQWETLATRVGPHGYVHGWIKVGAAGEAAATIDSAQKYIATVSGKLSPRELNNYDVASYKRTRLDPLYNYSPEEMKAIEAYCETKYQEINDAARAGRDPGHEAAIISGAMRGLPDDLVLLRELSGSQALSHLNAGDVIHDAAFSSTTMIGRGHFASGRSDTTVMHILTPKGTPALYADPASGFPEDEIILDRGQPMVVIKRVPRPGRGDVTDVYVLVLPKEHPN